MCPTILLPGKDNVVIRGPEDLIVADNVAKHATLSFVGFPDLAASAGLNVGDADSPWLTGPLWTKSKGLPGGRRANTNELFAVARPHRLPIPVDTCIPIHKLLATAHASYIND